MLNFDMKSKNISSIQKTAHAEVEKTSRIGFIKAE